MDQAVVDSGRVMPTGHVVALQIAEVAEIVTSTELEAADKRRFDCLSPDRGLTVSLLRHCRISPLVARL